MDPFRMCLALGPVAIYLLLLGMLNLSRRPFLVAGSRDTATLGLAVSGFAIVGPIELFFPDRAAALFGPYVWLMLLALYCLTVSMVVLSLRPRLVLYNVSADQLRPVLADLADQLDPNARWAGDSLLLPELGIQLHLDVSPMMRNVSLVSVGLQQNYLGWRALEDRLREKLTQVSFGRNPGGIFLLSLGLLIISGLSFVIAQAPQDLAGAMFEMLRLNL